MDPQLIAFAGGESDLETPPHDVCAAKGGCGCWFDAIHHLGSR